MNLPIRQNLRSRAAALCTTLLASSCLYLAVPSVTAQTTPTGTVTGRVLNAGTGAYLRNVMVTVAGTEISTLAEDGGNFILPNVPAGEVKLVFSYTGLDTKEVALTVTPGQTVQKDVTLSNKAYDDVISLGAFEVKSAREGNAKAIMEQRYAPNQVKVIAADSMGNVSEGNVGEFLKLMPGIAMDYVEADTRTMRIRGLNPVYANVLLDGHSVAQAGSANIGTGRAFEFEQLSLGSIETVEVTKTPTADMPSSVAGTVSLRTKSAFDTAGRRFTYKVGFSANSYFTGLGETQGWDDRKHRKVLPNTVLEYSDIYLDGKLGVYAAMANSLTMSIQKSVWLFYNNADTDPANDATEVLGVNRVWFQDGPKSSARNSYTVRVDYKATPELTLYTKFDVAHYDARFYNRTLSLYPGTYSTTVTQSPTNATVSVGRASLDSNQYMEKYGQTNNVAFGGTYKKGTFTVSSSLAFSRAYCGYESPKNGFFSDWSTSLNNISWTMTRPAADSTDITFTQTSGPDWRNPGSYTFDSNSIQWHERHSTDSQWTERLDFKHDFNNWKVPNTLKYGAMATARDLEVHRYGALRKSFNGADGLYGTADDPRPADYVDSAFSPNWGINTNLNGMPVLSPWKIYKAYQATPGWFVDDAVGNLTQRLRNNWKFKETINSLYLQDTLSFGKLDITPGLRYEATKSSGVGAKVLSDAQAIAASGGALNSIPFITAKYGSTTTGENSYSNALSFLNATYKVSKDFQLRASYHQAITRAQISNLTPGISNIDEGNQVLTASNPDLKPERSTNINLSAEYYFEPVGAFSASVFSGTVQDLQYGNRWIIGADGYEGDKTYANWTLSAPTNVNKTVKRTGIEFDYTQQLSFLPGVFKGLGVFTNYCYTRFDDWAFYLGSPTTTANGGITYRLGKWSGRVNLNWTGKLLQNPARTYSPTTDTWTFAAPYQQQWQQDILRTDINLEYKINRYATVYLDGRNIFNSDNQHTYMGTPDNWIRILHTGSIWEVGVRGSF